MNRPQYRRRRQAEQCAAKPEDEEMIRAKKLLGRFFNKTKFDGIVEGAKHVSQVEQGLSISTRGIGFMVVRLTSMLRQEFPKVEKIPTAAIYRISLVQLEVKLTRERDLHPSIRMFIKDCFDFNFPEIAMLINSIGEISKNNKRFRPVFEKEQTPVNLRIIKLREYCDKMTDLNTDPVKRKEAFELNSIPTAIWARANESNPDTIRLTNPDDIVPPDYLSLELSAIRKDMDEIEAYFDTIDQRFEAKINFGSPGKDSILVCTSAVPGQCVTLENGVFEGNVREFWAPDRLSHQSWCHGVIGLFGEVLNPIEVVPRSNTDGQRCTVDWRRVCDEVFGMY